MPLREIGSNQTFFEIRHHDRGLGREWGRQRFGAIQSVSRPDLLAEIGPEAAAFPTPEQLAAWIGVCPGSNQSAEENHSGRSAKGNRFMRRLLRQAAQAAARTNDSH